MVCRPRLVVWQLSATVLLLGRPGWCGKGELQALPNFPQNLALVVVGVPRAPACQSLRSLTCSPAINIAGSCLACRSRGAMHGMTKATLPSLRALSTECSALFCGPLAGEAELAGLVEIRDEEEDGE